MKPIKTEKPKELKNRLYVGNLPKLATEESIKKKLIERCKIKDLNEIGVTHISVIKNKEDNLCRGFAFLTFDSEQFCSSFLSKFLPFPYDNFQLKINYAK